MFKKRTLSVYNDHKTGFFCKFFFFIGILFLLIVAVVKFLSLDWLSENHLGSMIAFAIIFLFISGILYFFHCQFAKLAQIAQEIENLDEQKNK
jgi:Zn-dependent protease with chaperone function